MKCWQSLNIRNFPELLQPKDISKFVDERGVVVGLQPELIDAISHKIADSKSKLMQKMYHIGKTYSSSIFSKVAVERLRLAP